jgi:hypothetical protein
MTTLDSQVVVRRSAIVTFSQEFEHKLLSYPTDHSSLSDDLEFHVAHGLTLLPELQGVNDIKNQSAFKKLMELTNHHTKMEPDYFKAWTIDISEDLLDAIDLITLTHGKDLLQLGLKDTAVSTMLVLCATASLLVQQNAETAQNKVTHKTIVARLKARGLVHENYQA